MDTHNVPNQSETGARAGAAACPAPVIDAGDPDPIVASFDMFVQPRLPEARKIIVLQHPNKYNANGEPYMPTDVRIKPMSGMVEVDVPLPYQDGGYDRERSMRWGQALKKSMASKNGGSHGLAGGFGVGVPPPRAGGRRGAEYRDIYEWNEAVRQDKVLRTQTLGGIYREDQKRAPQYMIGMFKGSNIHLTPATSVAPLRPQLHHIDAKAEQQRVSESKSQSAPGGANKDGAPPTSAAAAPKAIHMTIKNTSNGEATTETMNDRLRRIQIESWRKMKYTYEEDDKAYEMVDKALLYRGFGSAADAAGKGKGTAAGTAAADAAYDKSLVKDAMRLETSWGPETLYRNIAGTDRAGILEGYGSTATNPKAEDEVEIVKTEEPLYPSSASTAARKPPSSAPPGGKGKGKATIVVASSSNSRR